MKSTNKQVVEMLNAKGNEILELKRVLFGHRDNSLIYDGLANSIKKSQYPLEIYHALLDEKIDEHEMESALLTVDAYINKEAVAKVFGEFQQRLSVALENKRLKFFQTDLSLEEGSVLVVRKFGIGLDNVQRRFRLTQTEALEQLDNGFIEQYAKLKLKAAFKDIEGFLNKNIRLNKALKFTTTDFYFNADKKIYSVDVVLKVMMGAKFGKATASEINSIAENIVQVLTKVEEIVSKEIKE